MNFLGFAFPLALLIAVQLTTFTWAATNVTKTSDYDEQGKHLGEQPVRRMLPACNLNTFSLGNSKPTFPEQSGVTLPLCPDNQYATVYNNKWGIARYSLYKITGEQATKPKVPRPRGDPWQLSQTPGIHQGSTPLYREQPIPGKYERGHLVPVDILRYSDESARATFTYTNCVPQIAGFNRGQWKKYELRIGKYARKSCSPKGGTLFLMTGTSKVKFIQKSTSTMRFQGEKKVVTKVEPLLGFHDNEGVNKIAIPNSM